MSDRDRELTETWLARALERHRLTGKSVRIVSQWRHCYDRDIERLGLSGVGTFKTYDVAWAHRDVWGAGEDDGIEFMLDDTMTGEARAAWESPAVRSGCDCQNCVAKRGRRSTFAEKLGRCMGNSAATIEAVGDGTFVVSLRAPWGEVERFVHTPSVAGPPDEWPNDEIDRIRMWPGRRS